jgi:hypothetical protein
MLCVRLRRNESHHARRRLGSWRGGFRLRCRHKGHWRPGRIKQQHVFTTQRTAGPAQHEQQFEEGFVEWIATADQHAHIAVEVGADQVEVQVLEHRQPREFENLVLLARGRGDLHAVEVHVFPLQDFHLDFHRIAEARQDQLVTE